MERSAATRVKQWLPPQHPELPGGGWPRLYFRDAIPRTDFAVQEACIQMEEGGEWLVVPIDALQALGLASQLTRAVAHHVGRQHAEEVVGEPEAVQQAEAETARRARRLSALLAEDELMTPNEVRRAAGLLTPSEADRQMRPDADGEGA